MKTERYNCPCWVLKPGATVRVKGWVPLATVVSMRAVDWTDHRIVVRYETVTAHEVEYRCHDLEKVCLLEQLAMIE